MGVIGVFRLRKKQEQQAQQKVAAQHQKIAPHDLPDAEEGRVRQGVEVPPQKTEGAENHVEKSRQIVEKIRRGLGDAPLFHQGDENRLQYDQVNRDIEQHQNHLALAQGAGKGPGPGHGGCLFFHQALAFFCRA